ncbi:hypothetical protein [Streptomyces sp. NBC_00385]|uniref:hypothetical protein n=1 Tax=Streptomyces sp. NBC_00385 TaxID=2975733 RepID=UPI002DDBE78B|nr:hypothetical protein [Streptomyces sp. NBC_00385]
MSSPNPAFPPARARRLMLSPVVRHDGRWWLVSRAGSMLATDPDFTSALNDFSTAVTAADQAVAELHTRQSESPASGERR